MPNLTVSSDVDSFMQSADYAAMRSLLGFDTPLACRIEGSAAKNFPTNTLTFAEFDTEVRDDGGFANLGSNNTRLTVPTGETGWYQVSGQLFIGTVATGTGGLVTASDSAFFFRKNGTDIVCQSRDSLSSVDPGAGLSTLIYLTAGDYVELGGFHNYSGTLLQRTESAQRAYLAIAKIR